MSDTVLAVAAPSPVRRWIAVSMLIALGALVVWLAATAPTMATGARIGLFGAGALAFYMAERMRRATETWIELTGSELRDGRGRVLCGIGDIAGIDRGAFAFKPSNGFTVRLKHTAGARAWQPGMWWRIGPRIGVGGVIPAAQTKYMADVIALRLRGG